MITWRPQSTTCAPTSCCLTSTTILSQIASARSVCLLATQCTLCHDFLLSICQLCCSADLCIHHLAASVSLILILSLSLSARVLTLALYSILTYFY